MCLEITIWDIKKHFMVSYFPVKTIDEAKDICKTIAKYNKEISAEVYENGKRTKIVVE